MSKNENKEIDEIKKEIVLERLRQIPPNVKLSFGSKSGEFMSSDKLIEEVERNTKIGKKIIDLQMAYLKAFKKGSFMA